MTFPSRRQVLKEGLVASLGSFAGCLGFDECSEGRTIHETDVSLSESARWPTFQYDAANTGYNPHASGPTEDPEVAWRYSDCGALDSGAVISGGNAYAGGLVVDGQTGQRIGGGVTGHMSTPTIADGTLFAGNHNLEAVDPATGELLWTFQTDGVSGGLPAPTVTDGTVYVPGNIDDPTLYAVDAETSDERWRFQTKDDIRWPAAVSEETVYIVDDTKTVSAIDPITSEERWQVTYETDISDAGIAVIDGTIYLGTDDGEIIALSPEDGTQIWRQQVDLPEFMVVNPIAGGDGTVFAAGTGAIVALEAASGRLEWEVTTEIGKLSAPAVADDVVYVGASNESYSGDLFALDAATGEELWRIETRIYRGGDHDRGGIVQGPAVVDGLVYVVTMAGDLYAVTEQD